MAPAKSIAIDIFETACRTETPYTPGKFFPKSDRIERCVNSFRFCFDAKRLASDIELALIDV